MTQARRFMLLCAGLFMTGVVAVGASSQLTEWAPTETGAEAMAAALADYYRQQQGWEAVMEVIADPNRFPGRPASFTLADRAGQVIVSGAGYRPGTRLSPVELAAGTPILVDGQRVGTILVIVGASGAGPMAFWSWVLAAVILLLAAVWVMPRRAG
jgi:hypothetical protein